jgi:hypothetical protein
MDWYATHSVAIFDLPRGSVGDQGQPKVLVSDDLFSHQSPRPCRFAATPDRRGGQQVQQALLRAGIDLAENMKSRYEGDFNFNPQGSLPQ